MVDDPSSAELALGMLLERSASLRPDELPDLVTEAAAMMGLDDAAIHMVDKRQLVLSPLQPDGGERVDIDGSTAGLCYRRTEVVSEAAGDGRVRLWFPIVDGTTRMGVIGAVVADDTDLVRRRGGYLGQLTGELLISKSQYGDHILTAQRLEPMTLAAEIRWALVPPLTFLNPVVSIAGYLEPAYDVAGDTFDYAVNDDTAHIAIFDAVGHGLEATRIANMAQLSYRHSRRAGSGLPETYAAMDDLIQDTFAHSAFATAQLATLDLARGTLCWINAGHPPPLHLPRGRPGRPIAGHPALPAGIAEEGPEVHEHALEPGDVVAFYTDGITEARSADGTTFGEDRLGSMVADGLAEPLPLPEIARRVVHAAVDHQGGDSADDATLVLIGWRLG